MDKAGTITATVLDLNDIPLSNISVEAESLDTSIATVESSKTTDEEGHASFEILGKSRGQTEVTVSVGSLTASLSVTVSRLAPSRVSVSSGMLKLSQCENESVTIKVFDNVGTPVPDIAVDVSLPEKESRYPHIEIDPRSGLTDEDGAVSFTITGLRKGGTTVKFHADKFVKTTKVRVKKTRIIPVGTKDHIVITVLRNGNPNPGVTVLAKSSDTDVIIVDKRKITDKNGEARFTVKGVGEGNATVTFTTGASSGAELRENIMVIRASQVEVSEKDVSISVGTSQDVVITATNVNGDPVTDENVYATMISGRGNIEITPSSETTDENGRALFTIKGIEAGNAVVKMGVCGLMKTVKVGVLP